MKKIVLILVVLMSVLFVSCQAKYKEVVLDDGTVVYTLESDDVDSSRVKRIFDKSLQAVEKSLDDVLATPSAAEEYKKFEDGVSARMEQNRKEMDNMRNTYFPELND